MAETGSDTEKGLLAHLALQHCDILTGVIPEPLLARAGVHRDWLLTLVKAFLDSRVGREVRTVAPQHVLREERFRCMLPGTAGTALVGVIDMLYEHGDGWTIVEFKTGAPRRRTRELHLDQTRVYACGLKHERGLEVKAAVIAYLTAPESDWLQCTPQEADVDLAEITNIATAVSRQDFPACPSRDRCAACPFGGSGGICPERYRQRKASHSIE